MPDTDTKTRTRRTPEQIAKEDLAKAADRRDRAVKRRDTLKKELKAAEAEVERADRFHDYAAKNPDLPDSSAQSEHSAATLRAVGDDDERRQARASLAADNPQA
jgi:hypothetical protein